MTGCSFCIFSTLFWFPLLSSPHLTNHAGTNQVQVLITDENDCVPEFLQSIYSVDGVPETVTTATSLLQGETPLTPYLYPSVSVVEEKVSKKPILSLGKQLMCFRKPKLYV